MFSQQQRRIIKDYLLQGISVNDIAYQTGISVATIYNIRKEKTSSSIKQRVAIPKKLISFIPYIEKRMRSDDLTNLRKIYDEIQAKGYMGSEATMRRYIKEIHKQNIVRSYKPSMHVVTKPGEQAQVDWGYFGKIQLNGRIERLYGFIYLLAYSRAMYVEFTIKQNLATLLHCHMHAFKQLGFPKEIVYDNMKTVVLRREKLPDGTPKINFNAAFLHFAQYYGFEIKPMAPRWPRGKGKVESMVKYVKYNFMQGKKYGIDFKSLDELNEKVKQWIETVHQRIHGETKEKPIKLWVKERPFLVFPNNFPPYKISAFETRFSTKDGLVEYKSNVYPVPSLYARRKLFVKVENEHGVLFFEIYDEEELIAKYLLCLSRNVWINESDAIFFKAYNDQEQKMPKKLPKKKNKSKAFYPAITPRPINYYNKLIPGGKIK